MELCTLVQEIEIKNVFLHFSLRKKPTFCDSTTGFPAKWRLRNERRNSILMTRQYPDLGSASDWSCHVGNLIQPVRSTTQIWIVMRHQYRISVLVSQTSFGGETSGCVVKCPLFSRVTFIGVYIYIFFIGVCLLFTSHIRILERVLSSKTLQSFSNARFTISASY